MGGLLLIVTRSSGVVLGGVPHRGSIFAYDAAMPVGRQEAGQLLQTRCTIGILPRASLTAAEAGRAEIDTEEKLAPSVTWAKNTNLGRFTNFVNLLDMAAVAVPSGILKCEAIHSNATGGKPHPSLLSCTWRHHVSFAGGRLQTLPAMSAHLNRHVSAG